MCRRVRCPASRTLALLAVVLPSSLSPSTVRADDLSAQPVSLPPVVVSATRLPTPEDQLGSSVTVITADDIERKQERTLPDVLQDVPGLNLVQTGGPGGTASVFMRGTNANHTKVLVDGVDVGDPSSVDGSFDFSQILAADISRVEVLRGPQSGLYGSDAIGGVINIITKTGSGPPKLRASIEGGLFGTFNQTAGVSGSMSRFNYAFDVAHFHSDDTPVTPPNLVSPGRPVNGDSYDNTSYATKLGAVLTDNLDVGVTTRYVETGLRSTSDDFLGPEATPSDSDNRELFTRGTAHLVLFDGILDQTVGIGYTNYRRRSFDPNSSPADPSYFRGDRVKLDWQGNIKVTPDHVLTLGAEHQKDAINDSSPVQAQMTNNAGFAQLQSSFGKRFFDAISLRFDDNDRFGSKVTWRVAPAFLIPETDTKLKGSAGTGFKAPTLDELFDSFPQFNFFANPNLRPETSIGYDFGFEQGLFDKRVALGATYFHNDIKNLINVNNTGTTYVNIGQATTWGAETFVSYNPWEAFKLRADYTYTIAEDDILHQALIRRPKHKASLNADWQVTESATLTATVLYVGSWIDISRSGAASGLTADGYMLVNIAGSYDIGHGVTAFARVNNLLDHRYQDPIGFQHQGLGVFAGVRLAFDTAKQGG
ncbi:MAG: Vitamin transporter [Rhodospirillales bacterium]|jgi:vitamin B12 transporter|nr:Vitamin transporter [Rhodospirillales bacterium]